MNPFKRGDAPQVLTEAGPAAADSFVKRCDEDPGASFFWPKRDGRSILPIIREALAALTSDHCSYCDGYPIDTTGEKEVDHFRPKRAFPREAFDWKNLYLVCTACNKAKLDEWNAQLLRPDDPTYSFERYFWVDALTGELKSNPAASDEDQARAKETIRIFNLQRGGLCSERRRAIASSKTEADPNRPFRFLWPDGGACHFEPGMGWGSR